MATQLPRLGHSLIQRSNLSQFFPLASIEVQALRFEPISDSARKSKETTEKQYTGSITSQRNHCGIDIQSQEEPWLLMQEESWQPARELPRPLLSTHGTMCWGSLLKPACLRGAENHLDRIKEGKSLMRKTFESGLKTTLQSSLTFQVHTLWTPFKITKTPNRICHQIPWAFNQNLYITIRLLKQDFIFIIYYWNLKPSKWHFNRLSTLSQSL